MLYHRRISGASFTEVTSIAKNSVENPPQFVCFFFLFTVVIFSSILLYLIVLTVRTFYFILRIRGSSRGSFPFIKFFVLL